MVDAGEVSESVALLKAWTPDCSVSVLTKGKVRSDARENGLMREMGS
jgi:hypothetical protein